MAGGLRLASILLAPLPSSYAPLDELFSMSLFQWTQLPYDGDKLLECFMGMGMVNGLAYLGVSETTRSNRKSEHLHTHSIRR